MEYFDLHCDTLVACENGNKPLAENTFHIDLKRGSALGHYVQCFAVFVADGLPKDEAFPFFERVAHRLHVECAEHADRVLFCRTQGDLNRAKAEGKMGAILTVENGAALSGDLRNLDRMAELGVRMMTLTWNAENEIGGGIGSKRRLGLTDFGRRALERMEELGIIADVSHASEALFADVVAYATKPFVASHSNAKKLCSHPRNLTDEQFRIICERQGLVGLNFYRAFLNDAEEEASRYDILRHAEHFLSLGGENVLAMGSDFDGADLPHDLKGLESIGELYELFLKENYSEALVRKIFFKNAENFFFRNHLL